MKIDPKMLLGGVVPVLSNLYDAYRDDKRAESEEEKKRRMQQELGGVPVPKPGMKKGGKVKVKASSASKRADGIAKKGKTRGKFV